MENIYSLKDFELNEAAGKRGRPRKNATPENDDGSITVVAGGQVKDVEPSDINKLKGKDEKQNGSKGHWRVDHPKTEDLSKFMDNATLSRNEKRLKMRFSAKKDFFVMGHAGWAKTALIKTMASKYKMDVITVYLDKAVKSDLGGIPIPQKDEKGVLYQDMAMPMWAAYMYEHSDTQFLLFFDEMNQADPDVQNALMPIVQEKEICGYKFNNFMVGAAGNYVEENEDGVTELSGPLKSRFAPIIYWEDGGSDDPVARANAWRSAFKYIHSVWDVKISKKVVDKFEQYADLFKNPREIEQKIFDTVYTWKQNGETDWSASDIYDEYIVDLIDPAVLNGDSKRSAQKSGKELADVLVDWLQNGTQETERQTRGGNSKNTNKDVMNGYIEQIKKCIESGYALDDDGKGQDNEGATKVGISKENYMELFDDDLVNREEFERYIKMLEQKGMKWKYEKNSDFSSRGYATKFK